VRAGRLSGCGELGGASNGACGKRQVIDGEPRWPSTEQDAHRQVLVDNDHRSGSTWAKCSDIVVGAAVTAKKCVGGRHGVEGGLELVPQVARHQAQKQFPVTVGDPGVAREATPVDALPSVLRRYSWTPLCLPRLDVGAVELPNVV
jgi:hypothetical protein